MISTRFVKKFLITPLSRLDKHKQINRWMRFLQNDLLFLSIKFRKITTVWLTGLYNYRHQIAHLLWSQEEVDEYNYTRQSFREKYQLIWLSHFSESNQLQGVTKRMKISRRVLANDGTAKKEEKVLTINVKPGWKSGTKITFQREGDQAPNKIPADIVFIIRDKPHQHFKREGPDLKYSSKITLKEVREVWRDWLSDRMLSGCFIRTLTLPGWEAVMSLLCANEFLKLWGLPPPPSLPPNTPGWV